MVLLPWLPVLCMVQGALSASGLGTLEMYSSLCLQTPQASSGLWLNIPKTFFTPASRGHPEVPNPKAEVGRQEGWMPLGIPCRFVDSWTPCVKGRLMSGVDPSVWRLWSVQPGGGGIIKCRCQKKPQTDGPIDPKVSSTEIRSYYVVRIHGEKEIRQ